MGNDEDFLTVSELSLRIKFARQTIYNMISKGLFINNIHYFKPSKKKILFRWSAVEEWLKLPKTTDQVEGDQTPEEKTERQSDTKPSIKRRGKINI